MPNFSFSDVRQKQLFSFPRGKSLNDSVDVFNGIFTFMFVRDPFERLNSAFQVNIRVRICVIA